MRSDITSVWRTPKKRSAVRFMLSMRPRWSTEMMPSLTWSRMAWRRTTLSRSRRSVIAVASSEASRITVSRLVRSFS